VILLDSNILIAASRTENNDLLEFIVTEDCASSVVSYVEVFGYPSIKSNERLVVERIYSLIKVFPVDLPIAHRASEIRLQRKIKTPDALIAATALEHHCSLATDNEKDFSWIEGLTIINPLKK
jgi:predicted nucleic acid-binding protein